MVGIQGIVFYIPSISEHGNPPATTYSPQKTFPNAIDKWINKNQGLDGEEGGVEMNGCYIDKMRLILNKPMIIFVISQFLIIIRRRRIKKHTPTRFNYFFLSDYN